MIKLYEHNRIAYAQAVSMLAETGKAAIVHPTGTGKSFIGFRLCEDNPEKTVCWLSPSEYIFKTQLENLSSAAEGYTPENVRFFTYAKLMLMEEAELLEIRPDYIVPDEFHRCGAEMWGKGVKKLLSLYPEVPMLGLSATNIRYLDNQRDMADELFDGNVASEMTLGEAIVRGILNAPKYVISVFAYQRDLEKYEARVKRAKNKVIRDEAERYLEALRRALDKADGLDEIFRKHMTEPHGKYIVFCANKEHMDDMMEQSRAWFKVLDKEPHYYSVYAEDAGADKSFRDFKADDSDHLRLLFCIDALNEGVHVENIHGVILLRPTISPIIYKQQIGRALSASKSTNAVIFDIVMNIENLYSIGAIEEEMQVAMTYYRSLGNGEEIVNEHFRVIDEVRDCRELFDRLNETLTASWELMYGCARRYYEQNGNLLVPRRYKTEDGYPLGSWLLTQRRVRSGDMYGNLGQERIAKLDAVGMVWDSFRDISWERNYEAIKEYGKAFGNLNVPARYVTETGLQLGKWVANLRTWRKSGSQLRYLTEDRIRALDDIGMIWSVSDHLWQQYFGAGVTYYREHGDLDVPGDYVTADGLRLGKWIYSIRSQCRQGKSTLSPEQIEQLNELGMLWDKRSDRRWELGYREALKYRRAYGNLNVPTVYKSETGYPLGRWLSNQRQKPPKSELRKKQLADIGMVWDKGDPWETRFALAKAYFEEYGDLNVSGNYVTDGIWLGKWVNEQKHIYLGKRSGKRLTREQIERLSAIGMTWAYRTDEQWERQYECARQFYEKNGSLAVPTDCPGDNGKSLYTWLVTQRVAYKSGRLSEERIRKLDAIGMVWVLEDSWETGFMQAKRYYEEFGDLLVPAGYTTPDGYALGSWINNQRTLYKGAKKHSPMSKEQITRLEQIGMIWYPRAERWDEGYRHFCDYMAVNTALPSTLYVSEDGYKLGAWVRLQKRRAETGRMSEERMTRLKEVSAGF